MLVKLQYPNKVIQIFFIGCNNIIKSAFCLCTSVNEYRVFLYLIQVTKDTTAKCDAYKSWIEVHCHVRHYTFQIKKCDNATCCLPNTNKLSWLPDPVMDDSGKHYKHYEEVSF